MGRNSRPPEAPDGPHSSPLAAGGVPPQPPITSSLSSLAAPPDPDGSTLDQIEAAREVTTRTEEGLRWAVLFRDSRRHGEWIIGRLQHSPTSRWTTVIDMDNDVLAGDFLAMDDQIKVGSRLRIDIYDVVVDHHVQVSHDAEDPFELVICPRSPREGSRIRNLEAASGFSRIPTKTTRARVMMSPKTMTKRW